MSKKKIETFLEEEEIEFILTDCKVLSKQLGVDITRSSWIRKAILSYIDIREFEEGLKKSKGADS